ncbi:hypothetical protein FGL91_18680 [Microbacterium sp. CBA3102]|uniref:hypothetical protein n=1 Tax=Microbacterium sp. CBA3102 TaxID=2603598 RepID=UPI0011BB028E|nr:hypothetical protein [Microbacterium sp. CBA3102]QEA30394.1 hypothetical protein FGL91_18680 [Microbacterium sp. CBA3102]
MKGVDQVTRLRREKTGVDRYGNAVYGTVETPIDELALFAPKDVIPALEVGRSATIVEPSLYWLNAFPDIREDDRVRVRGIEYEVYSIPAEWRGPGIGGLVVTLRDSNEGVP